MGKNCGCKKCTRCPKQISNCCPTTQTPPPFGSTCDSRDQDTCHRLVNGVCVTQCVDRNAQCPFGFSRGITCTPTPTPSGGGGGLSQCGPCDIGLPLSNCCPEEDQRICGKVFLNCGVQFNNTEHVFGPCVIKIITNLSGTHTLQHLINIIKIDSIVTPPVTQTFRLPKEESKISNDCKKEWQCGQIIYVSNVSPNVSVNIIPPSGQTINGTLTMITLQPFAAGPPASQSGALLILAPEDPTDPDGDCIWYTLNI